MTKYEILLLLDPDHAEARQDEIVAHTREIVEKAGGTWQSHDAWGRRRLAYPIGKKEEGVYHLVVFDADGVTLDEVSRILKIDDAVLRHMATKHIAGSRTSAPRDEGSAPAAAAPAAETPAEAAPADESAEDESPADEAPADESETDVSAEEEQEYAPSEEEPAEAPAAQSETAEEEEES